MKINEYYWNIRKPGLEYHELDFAKSLEFLLMTANGIEPDELAHTLDMLSLIM